MYIESWSIGSIMKKIYLLLFFVTSLISYTQVSINEISTHNSGQVQDLNGDTPDWIELYNAGSTEVDLSGYYLSDDIDSLYKWQIDDAIIAPQGHLLLFASGNDIRETTGQSIPWGSILGGTVYSDANDPTTPGNSTVTPLDFTEISEEQTDGSFDLSARFDMAANDGPGELGYNYGGLEIDLGIDESRNLSNYNQVGLKATITRGRLMAFHVVQAGIHAWEGYYYTFVGNGIPEFEYKIPLYNGMQGLDLTQVKYVDVQPRDLGITDISVSDITFTLSEDIGSISPANYDYVDGLGSTIEPFGTTEIISLQDSGLVISATMDLDAPDSYAGIGVRVGDWEAIANLSEYKDFLIYGYLEKDKTLRIRLIEDEKRDETWTSYYYDITGTGDSNEVYVVPIESSLFDRSQLLTIQLEGADLDPVSFTFFDWKFRRKNADVAGNFLHTNFKLSSNDTLYLSDENKNLIQTLVVPYLQEGHSYGSVTDGTAQDLVYFKEPSPNQTNNGSDARNGYCTSEIVFSHSAGFYADDITLEIAGSSEIRYTLDGTWPTQNSKLYDGSIALDSTTVIKAACYANESIPDTYYTETYFVGYDSDLPVFSLSTNPDNFFSLDSGIYVEGPEGTFEDEDPYFGANYWEGWERPVTLEMFETDGSKVFEENCGVQVFGNYSKANPKKSLAFFFRERYGEKRLKYPLFPDHPSVNSFDDFILRNSGGDYWYTMMRDGFHAKLMNEVGDFESQKYRPAVLFINGEYWGVHNIREKSNADYFEENYGIEKEDIDILSHYYVGRNDTKTDEISTLMDAVPTMTYEEIAEEWDMSNLIDYTAFELYINNYDWPNNNIKYWRQRSTKSKWRYFLYDTDFSTGIYQDSLTNYDVNALHRSLNYEPGVYWPTSELSTRLLRTLIRLDDFKVAFTNRYCDLMNTTLDASYVLPLIDETADMIRDEMVLDRNRWDFAPTVWDSNLVLYKEFWEKREQYARLHLQEELNLGDEVSITLVVEPAEAGSIRINSIRPQMPWTGEYFDGIPVTIEAIANPGFVFDRWESDDYNLNGSTVEFDPLNGGSVTGHFSGSSVEELVAISEIQYHPSDASNTEDWVEIHNYGESTLEVSGWLFKDEKPFHGFTIPDGTIIESGGYIVLAQDKAVFESIYDDIEVLGPFEFGLDNGGEVLELYDNLGVLRYSVSYDDENGWAEQADGDGFTLELTDPTNDPNDFLSWDSKCFNGSPLLAFAEACAYSPAAVEEGFDATVNHVYPNPTTGILYFAESVESYSLYSISGAVLLTGENVSQIDLSYFESGLYLLRMATDGIPQTTRVVKE